MRFHTRIRLIGLPHAHVDTCVVVSEGKREVFAFFFNYCGVFARSFSVHQSEVLIKHRTVTLLQTPRYRNTRADVRVYKRSFDSGLEVLTALFS